MTTAPPTPDLRALEDQLGAFFEGFGLRRNVGRVWASLYLSPTPCSQHMLIDRTGLSAGLVSTALRELQHWGAVQVVPRSDSRRTMYVAEENLLQIGATVLHKRELDAVRTLREQTRVARHSAELSPAIAARLRRIEHAMQLTEAIVGLMARLARLPRRAVPLAARVLHHAHFLDRLAPAKST